MRIPVVVIGAGQAGLAMSRTLTGAAIDHVVLERAQVAHSWRTERWDSLRLLTPNWMSRLPGWRYQGADPHGFMTSAEVITFLDAYGASFAAPVRTGVDVERVTARTGGGFDVVTKGESWVADVVVAATGASSEPTIPALARDIPPTITQVTALAYRKPGQLPNDEVLVVGASASGTQIAEELQHSGRPVTLAVGEHVRVPRGYRGRDIQWWLDAIGLHDERYDEVDDIERARNVSSLQLVGSDERRTLDLNALTGVGVRLTGKLLRVVDGRAQFSGGLGHLVANADLKQDRLLDRIDAHVAERGLCPGLPQPTRPTPTRLGTAATELPLARFGSIVWATGYRPTFPWLDGAAFDRRGRLAHDGGVGVMPGFYVLGLPFMRRRKSSFLDGVGPDACALVDHIRMRLRAHR